jgi:pyruvate dehydrogenase E1 component beta subunit
MVLRLPSGAKGGGGSEHSQCVEALFMHGAGIKIAAPSTPYDAKGLLKSAIRDYNPVLFMEHKLLYPSTGEVPEEEYLVPLGKANVVREGTDVSIISYSHMLKNCEEAADELSLEGIEAEVIDLRSLLPWDEDCVFQSVRKTRRVLVAHEDHRRLGVGAEISSRIHEECFAELKAPVARVAAQDTPIPFSPELEKLCLPGKDEVTETARKLMSV